MQRPGWVVSQVSFVVGVWSVNVDEIKKNLEFFDLSYEACMTIFDEYGNILKGMSSEKN